MPEEKILNETVERRGLPVRTDRFEVGDVVELDVEFDTKVGSPVFEDHGPGPYRVIEIREVPDHQDAVGHPQWLQIDKSGRSISGAYFRPLREPK